MNAPNTNEILTRVIFLYGSLLVENNAVVCIQALPEYVTLNYSVQYRTSHSQNLTREIGSAPSSNILFRLRIGPLFLYYLKIWEALFKTNRSIISLFLCMKCVVIMQYDNRFGPSTVV